MIRLNMLSNTSIRLFYGDDHSKNLKPHELSVTIIEMLKEVALKDVIIKCSIHLHPNTDTISIRAFLWNGITIDEWYCTFNEDGLIKRELEGVK